MSARTQSLIPAFFGAIGLSLVVLAAIWAFWPQTKPPQTVANRPRPPQPTIQLSPLADPNASAYLQFWLEDQASAYARQLESATGESKRALETLLDQTLAELVALKAKNGNPIAPPATLLGERLISVQSKDN